MAWRPRRASRRGRAIVPRTPSLTFSLSLSPPLKLQGPEARDEQRVPRGRWAQPSLRPVREINLHQLGPPHMRFGRSIGAPLAAAALAALLAACSAPSDGALPLEPLVGRNTPRLDIEGPSHELRVFVDTSGNITGLETVRVRSQKATFVPKSDYGLGRKIAVSEPKYSRLRAALSERVPEVRISLYESPSGARGRVRGRVLASSFGEAGWDFSGYPAGWNPDTDPMTDTDREAFIDYYVAEYDYQANAWLEAIDLEEETGLQQVRSNASLVGLTNPVPSGTAAIR